MAKPVQIKVVTWGYVGAGLLLGVSLWLLLMASVAIAHTNNQASSGAVDAVGVIGILLSLACMGLGAYVIYVIYTENYLLQTPSTMPPQNMPRKQEMEMSGVPRKTDLPPSNVAMGPSTSILQTYPQLQL